MSDTVVEVFFTSLDGTVKSYVGTVTPDPYPFSKLRLKLSNSNHTVRIPLDRVRNLRPVPVSDEAYITDHSYFGLDSGEWCNATVEGSVSCMATRAEHTA